MKELQGDLLSLHGRKGLPVGEGVYRPTMRRVDLMNRKDKQHGFLLRPEE
jgi:hypothetical protein